MDSGNDRVQIWRADGTVAQVITNTATWPFVDVAAYDAHSLLIGALLVNRRKRLRAEHSLADRLQFETSLSGLSARFVDVVPETVAREIECALEQVTNLLTLDRGTVFEVSSDGLDPCCGGV